jgi:hypothetical protein
MVYTPSKFKARPVHRWCGGQLVYTGQTEELIYFEDKKSTCHYQWRVSVCAACSQYVCRGCGNEMGMLKGIHKCCHYDCDSNPDARYDIVSKKE